MSWVSNPIPVNKKQGTIRVCTDFCDLNHACPKDNFPMPFIDQIIDDFSGHAVATSLGCTPPKKSFEQATFGPHCFTISSTL
jgi:hypothetical protein